MTNLKMFSAAAIVASVISSPALAQAVISNPGACEAQFASANCQNVGRGSPYDPSVSRGYYHRRTAYGGPVGGAAGVAGAAVGTAAAVAAAPFGGWGNSYAAYGMSGQPVMYQQYGPNGWYGDWNTYATRNGIVCRPGTFVKGDDGLQHPCQ